MSIEHDNAKPAIGAIVHADKRDLQDPAFARDCLELLDERTVLVFPGISLTDEEQCDFSDMLGERSEFARKAPGAEGEESEIYKVSLDPEKTIDTQYVYATYFWHMDGVTVVSDPPRATLLSARSVAGEGGQTEFASTVAAFAALPAAEQARLEGLRALHSVYSGVRPLLDFSVSRESWGGVQQRTEQPLVHTSEAGRKSLILGVQAEEIVGMDLVEGRALLARLMEWCCQPDFKYSHDWSVGDLVVWRNLGTMHRVIPYDAKSGRLMHRTSLSRFKVPA